MTEAAYKELSDAAKKLCAFCEDNECENCMITRLLDDAYTETEDCE